VVLADAEEVDPDLVGEDSLLDDVPDRPGVGVRPAVVVVGPIAELSKPRTSGNAPA
jgi:hypothetical protein